MTAAKIMDVIARLPNCDRQAADAVSASTHVKLEDAPRLLNVHISLSVQTCGYVFDDMNVRNQRQKLKIVWNFLNENCMVIHKPDCYGRESSKKLYKNLDVRESTELGMHVRSSKTRVFLSVLDDIKKAGKKHNMAPMWKELIQIVDIGGPTSFLDHVYLRCTERECKPNETIIEQYAKMFEPRISAAATQQLPGLEKPHAQTAAWSYDMDGHAQKCVERYCEMANKKVEELYKVPSPRQFDHQFKQEELESVGEVSEVCSQIVFNCLYLARIGRPDILWSVHVTDD